jgi:cyanophycinase
MTRKTRATALTTLALAAAMAAALSGCGGGVAEGGTRTPLQTSEGTAVRLANAGQADAAPQASKAAQAAPDAAARTSARTTVVTNIVIGGGLKNCSSFNGMGQSANCLADWTTIVAQDPAFAGLTLDQVLFDPAVTIPDFRYSIDGARIAAFQALPEHLVPATTRDRLVPLLTARLADGRLTSGLDFAAFDDGKPLFADGLRFWSNGNHTDWLLMIALMCNGLNGDASASVTNGKTCTLSDANIAAVEAATFQVPADREKVVLVLRELQRLHGPGPILFRRTAAGVEASPSLRSEFRLVKLARDGSPPSLGLTRDLSATEEAALRHTFVDALVPDRRNRKVQGRSVAFLGDAASRAIYEQFVAAARAVAGGRTPTVGIVTASTENPFNDRDINVHALKSAGANVVWLPADGGTRQAIDRNACEHLPIYYTAYANTAAVGRHFHMDQVFPDLADVQRAFCERHGRAFTEALETLDGIFFTGGDQARHLESFITRNDEGRYLKHSAQLKVLQRKHVAGRLVVAGTSAGDSAQSGGVWNGRRVPMIAGGESWSVLARGFQQGSGPSMEGSAGIVYEDGGLGFFRFGPLDSHFSNRSREGRLVRLVQERGLSFGFGVDENTALVVAHEGEPHGGAGAWRQVGPSTRAHLRGDTVMRVVGEQGVYVVDASAATGSGAADGPYTARQVRTHYLLAGDELRIDADGRMSVTLDPTRAVLPPRPEATLAKRTRIQESGTLNYLKLAQDIGTSGAAMGWGTTEGSAGQSAPAYAVTMRRAADTVFRGSAGKVSYSGLLVSFVPCSGTCAPAP